MWQKLRTKKQILNSCYFYYYIIPNSVILEDPRQIKEKKILTVIPRKYLEIDAP